MTIHQETIALMSHGGTPTYIDVTPQVKAAIGASGITSGTCTVISPHTTCAVFFEEYVHDKLEDGTEFLQADLDAALSTLFPNQTAIPPLGEYRYPGPEHYADVASWPDAEAYLPGGDKTQLLNAEAHLKATLLGSSQVFAVTDARLAVGVTGSIYFVDFDRTRPRPRKCQIVVMGE
jgi:thiamine phosphate synthase YjbQ (UPF0047 family)